MQRRRRSATITQYERQEIRSKMISMFTKTAKKRIPDPGFHKRISMQVVNYFIDKAKEAQESGTAEYYLYATKPNFIKVLSNMFMNKQIDLFGPYQTADDKWSMTSGTGGLYEHITFEDFDWNRVPATYNGNNEAIYPLVMDAYPELDYYGSVDLLPVMPDHIADKITKHNDKMAETFDELGQQLTVMMQKVRNIKTKSMFDNAFPGLTALLPNSVIRKQQELDGPQSEMSEEDRLLRAATNMVVASELLEDD